MCVESCAFEGIRQWHRFYNSKRSFVCKFDQNKHTILRLDLLLERRRIFAVVVVVARYVHLP